jgi:propanediol dehydratase large subunit
VPIGREEVQSWCCMCDWSFLLVCTSGADGIENVAGVTERFSRLPVARCLTRSRSRDVPGADAGQFGVVGMPARLCPAGTKRRLMANLVER